METIIVIWIHYIITVAIVVVIIVALVKGLFNNIENYFPLRHLSLISTHREKQIKKLDFLKEQYTR